MAHKTKYNWKWQHSSVLSPKHKLDSVCHVHRGIPMVVLAYVALTISARMILMRLTTISLQLSPQPHVGLPIFHTWSKINVKLLSVWYTYCTSHISIWERKLLESNLFWYKYLWEWIYPPVNSIKLSTFLIVYWENNPW